MAHRDIVVIGASAGGVEALQRLVGMLPQDLPAAVFVTLHFPEHGTSVLPKILARVSCLPVSHAVDGEPILPGRVYVAPPDVHLLLTRRGVRLGRGAKENGNRPAIDPMFRSAALAFGPRVIGVLLTGNLDDGTAGMRAINRGGGIAVVQDPEEATFPSMPQSAIQHATIDRVVRLQDVASVVTELASEPIVDGEHLPMADDVSENAFAAGDLDAMSDPEHHPGRVSAFGCPECGGVLWELKDGEFTRFRCRVGHAWTGTALLSRQADMVDDAMWTALRILEESADLARQIAARHRARGADDLAKRFDERAESREERAAVIRASLVERSTASDAEAPGPRRAS